MNSSVLCCSGYQSYTHNRKGSEPLISIITIKLRMVTKKQKGGYLRIDIVKKKYNSRLGETVLIIVKTGCFPVLMNILGAFKNSL